MEKYITIVVDPNQKVFAVEKQTFLVANEEGLVRLNIEELTVILPYSIISFEKEIQTLLTEDQQYNLFEFLGKSKGVTITALAGAIDITKEEAKYILKLAIKNKVMVMGWNNTWKVYDKVVKERLLDKAKNRFLEEKRSILPETTEEQIAELRRKGLLGSETEGEVGEEVEGSKEVKENNITANVPSGKITIKSVKELQAELKALQSKLDNNKNWNEEETPHTVVDKINKIKAQLRMMGSQEPTPLPSKQMHVKSLPAKKLPVRKDKP